MLGALMRLFIMVCVGLVGCTDPGAMGKVDAPGTDGVTQSSTDEVDTGEEDMGPIGGTVTSGSQHCVQLTGDLDRVRADDDFLPRDGDARTLQVWARTFHLADQVAVGYGRPAPRLAWIIGTDRGHPYLSSGSAPLVADHIDIADGEWHHLAATWDGREAVLYVDGKPEVSGSLEVQTHDGDFIAGNSPSGDSRPWIGVLDDVRVFSRARLPQEFTTGDLEGDEVSIPWLMLWWDFEGVEGEGFGVEVRDRSSTGIDGITGGDSDSPSFPDCR